MTEDEKLLNLLRTSDSFFPMGSFAMSQGMEQIINENLLPKEKAARIINIYLEKIWKTFDLGIFYQALEAIEKNEIEFHLEQRSNRYAIAFRTIFRNWTTADRGVVKQIIVGAISGFPNNEVLMDAQLRHNKMVQSVDVSEPNPQGNLFTVSYLTN